MRWHTLLLALAGLLLALTFACGGDDDDTRPTDESDVSVQEIVVALSDELDFAPNQIEVTAGEPVRLTITNEGTALHDFTVEVIEVRDVVAKGSDAPGHDGGHGEPDLHVAVDGGETATLEFTALNTGEYEFVCTVTGHAENGMVGTLLVV